MPSALVPRALFPIDGAALAVPYVEAIEVIRRLREEVGNGAATEGLGPASGSARLHLSRLAYCLGGLKPDDAGW